MAKNPKFDCWWLMLIFLAMWWLPSPVRAEEDRTYGPTALIEIAPASDFLTTAALLDTGALECSSADAFAIGQSYTPGVGGIFSTHKMVVGQMRLDAAISCRTTDREQIVRVLMIYSLLLSGHPSDSRTIARVSLESGAQDYVDVGALDF